MADDASARVHSLQSDENDLSLCRSNVEELSDANASDNWLMLPAEEELECTQIIAAIRRDFQEELDFWDATMVAEYSEEIFKYMEELEVRIYPPQPEVHGRPDRDRMGYANNSHRLATPSSHALHMLPETLWIAVNIIDRFLSKRVVSLVKFQLVGVTAMFVAAKYEEIMAPSVEEFVYMTENGYTRDDILKGEKFSSQLSITGSLPTVLLTHGSAVFPRPTTTTSRLERCQIPHGAHLTRSPISPG
ncbi:hypothetical protein H4Q26_013721 [Puccinia striiformis f. sp. tritici PST-130]|nr:hypothetical protein H4Q26_013721 [Puccinia striiformis f. sp. tritici PST-130]